MKRNLRIDRACCRRCAKSPMDAERQLFSAQIELARARLSQLESYIDLYRALGGGWSEQDLQKLASR